MNIYQKLSDIQSQISVTKSNYNSFGKYSYRSAEDILEAAKPVCKANGCVLTVKDEMVALEGRFYVKAIATLTDIDSLETIEVTAFAREEENKKGMDSSQVTGATSSYARKYALNGLFNLDDNKDADTDAYTETQRKAQKQEADAKIKAQAQADLPLSKDEEEILVRLIQTAPGKDDFDTRVAKICKSYGVEELCDLKRSQYVQLVGKFK